MTTVQITISDALAKEAEAEGLLETGSIEAILRERLAAARIAKMQVTRQKLSATGTPPLTNEKTCQPPKLENLGNHAVQITQIWWLAPFFPSLKEAETCPLPSLGETSLLRVPCVSAHHSQP